MMEVIQVENIRIHEEFYILYIIYYIFYRNDITITT